jgi:hypothetical protein
MRAALALVCLLATTASADSVDAVDSVASVDDRLGASLHTRIGSIRAPFYTAAHPVVRSDLQAYALIAEGWARIRPRWSVGARLAFATSSVEEPAGSYTADYTLGAPLLYVEHARRLRPATVGRARAGLGLPLAGSGSAPSLVRNRVLAASDALEGWRSTELYQPGTVPLVLEATVEHVRSAWRARARAELATLLRVTDAGLPDEADPRPIGLVPSAELDAGWRPLPWLAVGVGLHAVVLALPSVDPIRDAGRSGRAHLGLIPQVELVRGCTAFRLDLLVALAGPLDGSVGVGASVVWRRR